MFDDRCYIERSRYWIKNERKYLFEGLGSLKALKIYPSAANFHLIEIKDERMTALQLKENMAEGGILIRTAYGFNGLSEFYFRLAVKDRSSNDKLLKMLREIME